MGNTNWVHLEECDVLAVTDLAILLRYDDEEYWLPKSQVSDPDVFEKGDEGVTVSISEWIAEQKGIE